MSNLRRVIIAIIFLVVIGAAGYGLYYFFFRPSGPGQIPPGVNANANAPGSGLPSSGNANANAPIIPAPTGTGTLPPASSVAKGGPTQTATLVASPTLGETLSPDGKSVRYYDRVSGKFLAIDANGRLVELSNEIFPDVQAVTWSPDANKVVMEFPDGSKLAYDFILKKQATLPASWEDFSFSPQSDKLAAKQDSASSSNRYLVVANSDGTGAKPIAALGENGDLVDVNWSPSGDVIAFSQTGDTDMAGSFGEKQILFIGQNNENFPATVVDGLGFLPLWSPDGKYLLYSSAASADDFRPRLYVVTGSGTNRGSGRRGLNLFTFADKCVFADNSTAYCAVPDALPEGIGLERLALGNVPDSFYKVNVVTGAVSLVGRPDTDTVVSSLRVSSDGAALFFTDASSGSLKKIALK
jgi:hypothetical protein